MVKHLASLGLCAVLAGCASGTKPSTTSIPAQAHEAVGAKALFQAGDGVEIDSGDLGAPSPKSSTVKKTRKKGPSPSSHPPTNTYQGLSYWIERLGSGGLQRVTTSTLFRGGDRIRLHVRANRPGYLYIVNQGSSGRTAMLFPASETTDEYIQPNHTYHIPSSGQIRFDDQPGQELVWVFLSQRPLPGDNPGAGGSAIREASYNTCGSKDLVVEEPENLGRSCGVGAKDLVLEDDARDAAPAEYAASPVSALEKGSVLALRLVLRHE